MRRTLLLALLAACAREAPAPPPREAPAPTPSVARGPIDVARDAVGALKADLRTALTEALATGGPVGAISVCAEVAPQLAARATTPTLRVGRATTRPRNPTNAATGWQAEAIAHFARLTPAERIAEPFMQPLPGGGLAYAEALVVAGPCVLCHGQAIAPEVTAALAARYPSDQATGYADGDLRGIAWAEVTGPGT